MGILCRVFDPRGGILHWKAIPGAGILTEKISVPGVIRREGVTGQSDTHINSWHHCPSSHTHSLCLIFWYTQHTHVGYPGFAYMLFIKRVLPSDRKSFFTKLLLYIKFHTSATKQKILRFLEVWLLVILLARIKLRKRLQLYQLCSHF